MHNMEIKQFFTAAPYKVYIEKYHVGEEMTFVLIPGAYHTGVCYTSTPDGGIGWAQMLAINGFSVYVADLPGTGRCGNVPFESVCGDFLVEAYADFIKSIDGNVLLMTHSLSGPIGFKLAELFPEKISHLISIEPGLLGDCQEPSVPVFEDASRVKLQFNGYDFDLDMTRPSTPPQQFIERVTQKNSKHFPTSDDAIGQYSASLQAVHPRLLYERFNIRNSQLTINDYNKLKNRNLLMVTGTEDSLHRDVDQVISKHLIDKGVDIKHLLLKDVSIYGNGHMMMLEDNNEQILDLIVKWIKKVDNHVRT